MNKDMGTGATSPHYTSFSEGQQPIEVIQREMELMQFHSGFSAAMYFNMRKYQLRDGTKAGTIDTAKAAQYKHWYELAERGETIDPVRDSI